MTADQATLLLSAVAELNTTVQNVGYSLAGLLLALIFAVTWRG